MPFLEKTTIRIQGTRALEETFQSEWVRVALEQEEGQEPIGTFEKTLPLGEITGFVRFAEVLCGENLLSVDKEPVDEDGRSKNPATEKVQAGKGGVPQDGTAAKEKTPDDEAGDPAPKGSKGTLPEGENDDSPKAALKEKKDARSTRTRKQSGGSSKKASLEKTSGPGDATDRDLKA